MQEQLNLSVPSARDPQMCRPVLDALAVRRHTIHRLAGRYSIVIYNIQDFHTPLLFCLLSLVFINSHDPNLAFVILGHGVMANLLT